MRHHPRRSLGQHFLEDPRYIDAILRAVPARPAAVVEIGPGGGALTQPLMATGRPVLLIEKDRELAADWRSAAEQTENLRVLEADAADVVWLDAVPEAGAGVVSNLPYNVATPILRCLVESHRRFPWAVVMLQREVAERIEMGGGRTGGVMGLLVQFAYRVERVIEVPPGAFRPPPQVESRVLRLIRREDPVSMEEIPPAWSALRVLFQRRRAKLDKAVARYARVDRPIVHGWFDRLGIRRDARPDHLDVTAWRSLLARLGVLS